MIVHELLVVAFK